MYGSHIVRTRYAVSLIAGAAGSGLRNQSCITGYAGGAGDFGYAASVGMQMLDATSRNLPTRVVRNGGLFSNQSGPTQFTRQPAQAAMFLLAYGNVPVGSVPRPPVLRLRSSS